MSKFFSPAHASLTAYTPGEQPQDKKYIKLNTNEAPFSPPQAVLDAVNSAEVSRLNLYPDPDCNLLREAIAKKYGVSKNQVILGNGSDEILQYLFLAFSYGNCGAAFPDITYGFYKVFAALYNIEAEKIPLCENFEISYKDYLNKNKTIFIANPNAPTGIMMPLSEIEEIAASNPGNVVVIDEAYVDFGGESAIKLLPKYKNLVICRTFSKSRSLAGARLGFAIADEEIINDLNTVRCSLNPYNINRLTLLAGKAAIESDEYYDGICGEIIKNREELTEELEKIGFSVLPSKANFIFAKHKTLGGEMLYKELKEKGVLVRHFKDSRICDFLRITIGTKEECNILLSKLKEITN